MYRLGLLNQRRYSLLFPPVSIENFETPCRDDQNYGTVWGGFGRTAQLKLAQDCADAGFYNWKIQDCGGWKFKALCGPDRTPADRSRPISDEAARDNIKEGDTFFRDAFDFAETDCRRKGYRGAYSSSREDRGNGLVSYKCIPADCKRDQDYGNVWGGGNRTVSLKLAQECADKGFNNWKLQDCGDWFVRVDCGPDRIPAERSRPISDEAARDNIKEGDTFFRDAFDFAETDCRRKGFSGAYSSSREDRGNGLVSYKCIPADCKKDTDYGSVWGGANKTVTLKLAQDCADKGFYDWKLQDCGDWSVRIDCGPTKTPADRSRPISDEAARDNIKEGDTFFRDAFDFAETDCRRKGFSGAYPSTREDRGNGLVSYKCIPADCKRDENYGSVWGSSGKTVRMKLAQDCAEKGFSNWKFQDCGDWAVRVDCGPTKTPVDRSQPISNEAAIDNIKEGDTRYRDAFDFANTDCKNKGFGGADPSTREDHGEWMFSYQCIKPGFIGEWKDDGCTKESFFMEKPRDNILTLLPIRRKAKTISLLESHIGTIAGGNSRIKSNKPVSWYFNREHFTPNKTRRFRRQVDAKGIGWEDAADWILKTHYPVGKVVDEGMMKGRIARAQRSSPSASGIFVILDVETNDCDCKRDEDYGSVWGGSGKTAKMKLAQDCAEQGFYNWKFRECSPFLFDIECGPDRTPEDRSQPISDEAARDNIKEGETRYRDAFDFANTDCQNKGFGGADPNTREDRGEWMFSYKCIKPGLIGEWKDDGCVIGTVETFTPSQSQSFKSIRAFTRQVDAKTMDWEKAAQWLINNEMPKVGELFQGKKVVNVGFRKLLTGIWIFVEVEDSKCGPVLIGEWKDDGCVISSQSKSFTNVRAFTRQVDAKAMDWEKAAQWIIDNEMPKVGELFQNKKVVSVGFRKLLTGIWIVVEVEDGECSECKNDEYYDNAYGIGGRTAILKLKQDCSDKGFYDSKIIDCGDWHFRVECSGEIPSNYSSPISEEVAKERGYKSRYDFAMKSCQSKKFAGANQTIIDDKGDGVVSYQCINPTWKGVWVDEGCQAVSWQSALVGTYNSKRRYARQIDANGLPWEDAGEFMVNELKASKEPLIIRGKEIDKSKVLIFPDNKGVLGMFVVVEIDDDECSPGLSIFTQILIVITVIVIALFLISYIIRSIKGNLFQTQ